MPFLPLRNCWELSYQLPCSLGTTSTAFFSFFLSPSPLVSKSSTSAIASQRGGTHCEAQGCLCSPRTSVHVCKLYRAGPFVWFLAQLSPSLLNPWGQLRLCLCYSPAPTGLLVPGYSLIWLKCASLTTVKHSLSLTGMSSWPVSCRPWQWRKWRSPSVSVCFLQRHFFSSLASALVSTTVHSTLRPP